MGYKHYVHMNIGTPPDIIKDEDHKSYNVKEMDDFIINNFFKGNRILSTKYKSYIKSHPELQKYIEIRYKDSESVQETLKRIYFHIEHRPLCRVCGNPLPFIPDLGNYQLVCSKKCQYEDSVSKEKREKTNIERFGVKSPSMLSEQKRKTQETCIKKYGKYYVATDDRIKRTRDWCRKKYGTDWHSKTEDCKEKVKSTCVKRYGEDAPFKSEEIKTKIKETCKSKYGVEYVTQSNEFKEKSKKTCQNKYGVDYWVQSDDFKQSSKESCLKRWDSEFYITSNDCKQKIEQSRQKKNKYVTSKFETQSGELLRSVFSDVRGQYNSERYPFNCDFYVGDIDTFIELNGMWVHGKHPFCKDNFEDINELNRWIEKSKTSNYYKRAIDIWTRTDVIKRNWAKDHNLNFKEFWKYKELKDWIDSLNL